MNLQITDYTRIIFSINIDNVQFCICICNSTTIYDDEWITFMLLLCFVCARHLLLLLVFFSALQSNESKNNTLPHQSSIKLKSSICTSHKIRQSNIHKTILQSSCRLFYVYCLSMWQYHLWKNNNDFTLVARARCICDDGFSSFFFFYSNSYSTGASLEYIILFFCSDYYIFVVGVVAAGKEILRAIQTMWTQTNATIYVYGYFKANV